MSEPIGPGDWVECVRSRSLLVGGLYYVETIDSRERDCPCHGRSPFGLFLRDQPNASGSSGWCGLNFRPIYRPKSSLIQSLLKPIEADPAKEAA